MPAASRRWRDNVRPGEAASPCLIPSSISMPCHLRSASRSTSAWHFLFASGLYRLMARRMRGYDDAQARQIFRDIVDMSADVAITEREVTVRFQRRAHLPIVLASDLVQNPLAVPWWQGRSVRIIQ